MLHKPTHPDSILQADWLFLHDEYPPGKWQALPSFKGAAQWLGTHHSLKKGQTELDYIGRQYLENHLDWETFRSCLDKAAYLHYGHLNGHHIYEDDFAFPRLRRFDARLNQGFDLLEKDHQHIWQQLSVIDELVQKLKHTPVANPALAERLINEIRLGGQTVYRHLADEEDLVVPVLAKLDA